jgi:hypothetical protein
MQDTTFSRCHILSAVSAVGASAVLAEPLKAATPEPSGAGPGPTSWVDSAMPEVTHPALYMVGERDFVAAAFSSSIAKQSTLVPKLRPAIMLAGCGHWKKARDRPACTTDIRRPGSSRLQRLAESRRTI